MKSGVFWLVVVILLLLWFSFLKPGAIDSPDSEQRQLKPTPPSVETIDSSHRDPQDSEETTTQEAHQDSSQDVEAYVAGRVFDDEGQPAFGARVRYIQAESTVVQICEKDGSFAIPTKAGQVLTLTFDCDEELRWEQGLPPLIGQQVSGLRAVSSSDPTHEIYLVRGSRIDGLVVDPDGNPVGGAVIQSAKAKTQVQGGLVFIISAPPEEEAEVWPIAISRPDGTFILSGMPKPDFRIWAESDQHCRSQAINLQSGSREVVLELRPLCELRGAIVDSIRRPVSAAVSLWVVSEPSSWTPIDQTESSSSSGEFVLTSTQPGTHRVWVDDSRYAPSLIEVRLQPGENDRVEVVLEPASEWVGRALSSQGEPVVGARWKAAEQSRNTPQLQLRPALTDAEGLFSLRLPPLETGRAKIFHLVHPDHADYVLDTEAWGPGFHDLGDIYLQEGLTLRGQVINPAGIGVEGARVRLQPVQTDNGDDNQTLTLTLGGFEETNATIGDVSAEKEVTSGVDGFFVIPLEAPAEVEIEAHCLGYAPSESQSLLIQQTTRGIQLQLQELRVVEGQVVDLGGFGVGGVKLGASPMAAEGAEINFESLFGLNQTRQDSLQTVSNPEGFFRFEIPQDDRWKIRVLEDQDWIGKEEISAQSGDRNIQVQVVEGGRIEGTVIDSITRQAIPSFRLSRTGMRSSGGFVLGGGAPGMEISDADGYFELTGLPERDINVKVSRSGYVPWENTYAMAPGAVEEIVVELIPAATLTGTILNALGEPLPGARILVYRPGEQPPENQADSTGGIQISFGGAGGSLTFGDSSPQTRQDGVYEITDLAPGEWLVTVRHPEHQERTFPVSGLSPGTTTEAGTQMLDPIQETTDP